MASIASKTATCCSSIIARSACKQTLSAIKSHQQNSRFASLISQQIRHASSRSTVSSSAVRSSASTSSLLSCSVRRFATVPGHGSPPPQTGSSAINAAPAAAPSGDAYAGGASDPSIDIGVYDDPNKWADFSAKPEGDLGQVAVRRNAEGDLEGKWQGVDCIFPDQEVTLEWVLSTPVDVHLFDEQPIVKDCPDDDDEDHH